MNYRRFLRPRPRGIVCIYRRSWIPQRPFVNQLSTFGDGFDSLAREVEGIKDALECVQAAFSAPSASELMMAEEMRLERETQIKKSLRGQRNPAAELLWGSQGRVSTQQRAQEADVREIMESSSLVNTEPTTDYDPWGPQARLKTAQSVAPEQDLMMLCQTSVPADGIVIQGLKVDGDLAVVFTGKDLLSLVDEGPVDEGRDSLDELEKTFGGEELRCLVAPALAAREAAVDARYEDGSRVLQDNLCQEDEQEHVKTQGTTSARAAGEDALNAVGARQVQGECSQGQGNGATEAADMMAIGEYELEEGYMFLGHDEPKADGSSLSGTMGWDVALVSARTQRGEGKVSANAAHRPDRASVDVGETQIHAYTQEPTVHRQSVPSEGEYINVGEAAKRNETPSPRVASMAVTRANTAGMQDQDHYHPGTFSSDLGGNNRRVLLGLADRMGRDEAPLFVHDAKAGGDGMDVGADRYGAASGHVCDAAETSTNVEIEIVGGAAGGAGEDTKIIPQDSIQNESQHGESAGDENNNGVSFDGGKSAAISHHDMEEYMNGRQALLDWIKRNGPESLRRRGEQGACGLKNQGATCYMNSLLQALYMTPEFRSFLFVWRHDMAIHGPKDSCIPAQLQALFARMRYSSMSTIQTERLTNSFGWGSAAAFQQHDVSELLHLLFEALDKSTSDFAQLQSLYHADLISYIGSPVKGVWRAKTEAYMDLQVEVEGYETLESALGALLRPEVMDGDNKWRMDDGEEVQAVKGLWPVTLPPLLTLHLQRFKYTMRGREKVDARQSIPAVLNMKEILNNNLPEHSSAFLPPQDQALLSKDSTGAEGVYDLVAILLHKGTALGGHYRCCVRDLSASVPSKDGVESASRWLDCNDECVSAVSHNDLRSLLDGGEAGGGAWGCAYMLMYRSRTLGMESARSDGVRPDDGVMLAIQQEEEAMHRMARLYELHVQMCEVRAVLAGFEDAKTVTVLLPSTATLSEACDAVKMKMLSEFQNDGSNAAHDLLSSVRGNTDLVRLRRYDAFSARGGETFGGREQETLLSLGLAPKCLMVLETRCEREAFAEHNDFVLRVRCWSNEAIGATIDLACWKEVVVKGREKATVGGLRDVARAALGVGAGVRCMLVWGGRQRGADACVLDRDEKPLEAYGVQIGDEVVLEELCQDVAQGCSVHTPEVLHSYMVKSLMHYRETANMATILYNHPSRPSSSDMSIHSDLRWTLKDLKTAILKALDLSADTSLHFRRSPKGPQLKNEDATLASLSITHNSSVYVGEGPPRAEGEVLLKVSLMSAEGKLSPLIQMSAGEDITVAHLKELIAQRLDKMGSRAPAGWGGQADMLRLRDKKGKEIGKVLRDTDKLKKALPRICDGRELGVQVLSERETVGEDDIIVQVRIMDVHKGTLGSAQELVVSKKASLAELRKRVTTSFFSFSDDEKQNIQDPITQTMSGGVNSIAHDDGGEETQEGTGKKEGKDRALRLGLAKASAFGPPLDYAGALRLKWNDSSIPLSSRVADSPLSLRDGSIIVARDEEVFAARHPDKTEQGNVGPGARAGRGLVAKVGRGGTSSSAASRPPERAMKICVFGAGDVPLVDECTTDANKGGEGRDVHSVDPGSSEGGEAALDVAELSRGGRGLAFEVKW